jgi:hypothetical protein
MYDHRVEALAEYKKMHCRLELVAKECAKITSSWGCVMECWGDFLMMREYESS